MQVVERRRKREHKIGPGKRIFGVAAVHGVAGEDGSIAEVLHTLAAVPADSIDTANPRDANARSSRKVCVDAFQDVADDLMAGNQTFAAGRKFAFHNVKVGTANSARANFQ